MQSFIQVRTLRFLRFKHIYYISPTLCILLYEIVQHVLNQCLSKSWMLPMISELAFQSKDASRRDAYSKTIPSRARRNAAPRTAFPRIARAVSQRSAEAAVNNVKIVIGTRSIVAFARNRIRFRKYFIQRSAPVSPCAKHWPWTTCLARVYRPIPSSIKRVVGCSPAITRDRHTQLLRVQRRGPSAASDGHNEDDCMRGRLDAATRSPPSIGRDGGRG